LYRQSPRNYFKDCIWGLKEEIHKAREKTRGNIGVNIMVALSNFADMVRTAIAERPILSLPVRDYRSTCPLT